MRDQLAVLASSVIGAAALSGCASTNYPVQNATAAAKPSAPIGATVDVIQGAFAPSVVHVKVGEAVRWRWLPPALPAEVTFRTFHSAILDKGSYYHVFDTPGIYRYHSATSSIGMGTVFVQR